MKRITITIPEDLYNKLERVEGTNMSGKICSILNKYFLQEIDITETKLSTIEEDVRTIKALMITGALSSKKPKAIINQAKKWWQFWK